jgi:hypothetical protein
MQQVYFAVDMDLQPSKRAPRKREFPRGESPFCTPSYGDLLEDENGSTRFVLGRDGHHDGDKFTFTTVVYRDSKGKDHSIARTTWSQWCSRKHAKLVSRKPYEPPFRGKD